MKEATIGLVLGKLFKNKGDFVEGNARLTCMGCNVLVAKHSKDQINHALACTACNKELQRQVAEHALLHCDYLSATKKKLALSLKAAAEALTVPAPSLKTAASASGRPSLVQPNLAAFGMRTFSKEQIAAYRASVASLVHENGLPMTITSTSQWTAMLAVLVGKDVAGRELKISRRDLGGCLLDELDASISSRVAAHFERNVMPGCATLITDSVTDEKGGSICNSGVYVHASHPRAARPSFF